MTTVLTAADSNGVLALAALVITGLAGFWISIRRRPYTNCPRCNGGGKDHGEVFTRAYRHCRHCDGTGRTLRLGARLFRTTGNRR